MSEQVTITFQASKGLRDWLAGEAAKRELSLGGFVRLTCANARTGTFRPGVDSQFTHPAGPIMEAEQLIPIPRGRLLTVREAKRRAKGKATA